MKKKIKKLVLSKETLRRLVPVPLLGQAVGAGSMVPSCQGLCYYNTEICTSRNTCTTIEPGESCGAC